MIKLFNEIGFMSITELIYFHLQIGIVHKNLDIIFDTLNNKLILITYHNRFGIDLINVKVTEIRLKQIRELIGILHQPF